MNQPAELPAHLRFVPRAEPRLLLDPPPEVDHPVLIIGTDGAMLSANAGARLMLDGHRALCIEDDLVQPVSANARASWRAALMAAAHGERSVVLLELPGGSSIMAAVSPWRFSTPEGEHRCVMVILESQRICDRASLEVYAAALTLTASETGVMIGLAEGMSPKDLARRRDVAETTVRTQVRAVLAKTNCRGIRELVLRLAKLPPVAAPML